MSAQAPYDHAGPSVRASDEVNGLLREQGKIRNQFSSLLGATGIGRGAGSLKQELYWELLDVDDQGVVTLGASYSRGATGGTYQARMFFTMRAVVVTLLLHCIRCGRLQWKVNLQPWSGAAT
jgi:hypothetical protein